MESYNMRMRKLPHEILVYKEVARRILSSKQYKRFLSTTLVFDRRKEFGTGMYHTHGFKNYGRTIRLGIGESDYTDDYKYIRKSVSRLNQYVMSAFIHEVAHMAQFNNKNIKTKKNGRNRFHNKTFYNLLKKLEDNFNSKVKPQLPEIIASTQHKENEKKPTIKKPLDKTSPSYKLERTKVSIKRWETKLKRATNVLKKLHRREKIYERMLAKASSLRTDRPS